MEKEQKTLLIKIISSVVTFVVVLILTHLIKIKYEFVLYIIPYLIVGYAVLLEAVEGIKNKEPFDENFLMAVASIGAFALGQYEEAVSVMLFYQIGEFFEDYAVDKSRENISSLMDIRPDYANLVDKSGNSKKVDPNDVAIGSIILVKPGEKIPLDGIVIEGESTLDTSALTGESVPRGVRAGDDVLSGCINTNGLLKIETTKLFGESTASKILELVESASERKSRKEAFITKFARIYTPVVCFSAVAIALIPPLFCLLFLHADASVWKDWVYRALTFLVVSCPCALVISVPLTFFAGIGCASKAGVLIKGSNFVEALSEVNCLVFDKTGTLTKGNFDVDGIHHNSKENDEILYYAASGEKFSTHPISKSIERAYISEVGDVGKANIENSKVENVQEISGRGVSVTVDGKALLIGNDLLMKENNIEFKPCSHIGTVVHIAIDGVYEGHILIKDTIKPTAKKAIDKLKSLGITKLIMLSGDKLNVCEHVSNTLGLSEYHGELLPEGKVNFVEKLLKTRKDNELVCFVGDGMNDAPVLSMSDVGVAMGALGSEAAIEAADVVLMDDNPLKISTAIRIAKRCIRIVNENIWFAIGIKILCLLVTAVGLGNMWLAIFADVGVMILAVLNAIRALRFKEN